MKKNSKQKEAGMKNKILVICIASALCASFMTVCGQASVSDDTAQTNNSGIVDTLNESMGKQNALKAAKSYLDTASFSYQGLVEQLEFEKYTNEEAVYAVDNCGADWKKQALKSAKSYLDTTSFSYQGLVEQLEFEKYTNEEAVYAVDNCGADWKKQAEKSAKSYLSTSQFSRDELIEQLESEGFTNEQAVYGVEANGY